MNQGKQPWNDWYHITVHTYGSWLRGDPRGWRSRDHREHCEGDYKHPPPKGTHVALLKKSENLMPRDPVRIARELRSYVVTEFVFRLQHDNIQVIASSTDGVHVHVLARFPDHRPRHWIGLAKKHVSHQVRQDGLRTEKGGLWAKKCGVKRITDRKHQLNAFRYIVNHALDGAAVWRCDRDRGNQ